jgi:hypothetical protein
MGDPFTKMDSLKARDPVVRLSIDQPGLVEGPALVHNSSACVRKGG